MDIELQLKAVIEANEDLQITTKKSAKVEYKPYIRLGQPGYTNIEGSDQDMDACKLLLNITQLSQRNFLQTLIDNMDIDTNVAILRAKGLTASEKKVNSKAFIALKKLNIVRRLRREHYMLNPDFIVPSGLVLSRSYLQEKYNNLK